VYSSEPSDFCGTPKPNHPWCDIDGDGDSDAATCAKDSKVLAWFENDGKGKFTTRRIYEDQAAYDISLVDMDKDGDRDILVAGQDSKNVVWYENQLKRK
jgi:hypothetical protein